MLSSVLALTANPTTMTMPTRKPIVATTVNEESMETSSSCEGRAAEDFDEPSCPQDGREVSGKLTQHSTFRKSFALRASRRRSTPVRKKKARTDS